MADSKRARISTLVLIDTSLSDDGEAKMRWHARRMEHLSDCCNGYLKTKTTSPSGESMDFAVIAFNDAVSDFVHEGENRPVDLSLKVTPTANWDAAFKQALDYCRHMQDFYEHYGVRYYPIKIIFFSALPPGRNCSIQTMQRVRSLRASGSIELLAYGMRGLSALDKLKELASNVDTVTTVGQQSRMYAHFFMKAIRRLDLVLEGTKPYDSAETACAITDAIDYLKAKGIAENEIYERFSNMLEMPEQLFRTRLTLTQDDEIPFNIKEARCIVKVLNGYRKRMSEDFGSYADRIGFQYSAALTARLSGQQPKPASTKKPPSAQSSNKAYATLDKHLLPILNNQKPLEKPLTLPLPLDIPTDGELKLEELIGLEAVKTLIKQIIDFARFNQRYPRPGNQQRYYHMVFTGNPGTCKTTVARLIAQMLYEYDVLQSGEVTEVSRDGLVGEFVGSTAPKVIKTFDKARGGILFVDEAYSLLDDKHGLYGDEAIAAICTQCENRNGDPLVILAGYPAEMEALLNRNSGLRSRIPFVVHFPDYSDDELFQILAHLAKQYGYKLDDGVREKVMPMIAKAKNGDRTFGNGRWCRNLIAGAELRLASRVMRMPDEDATESACNTLLAEDFVEMPDSAVGKLKKRTIGFVVPEGEREDRAHGKVQSTQRQ